LNAFEWQDPPRLQEVRDADESYDVGNYSGVDNIYQTYRYETFNTHH